MTLSLGAVCPQMDNVPLRMFLALTCDQPGCSSSIHSCRGVIAGRAWMTKQGWIERENGDFE